MFRPSAKTRKTSPSSLARATLPAAVAAGLLMTSPARAASLTGPITGWASGVPPYISMFEYVPAKLAANPPILVVSHFCGGSASAVFGEAQGGGLVAAADQFGFLMIFPQTSNNCWDVGSTASLTHDGGGDTQAVAEMVQYEITTLGADPNRVYATGTSSGAMMTEALLAVYPDVFRAGAEFSGVPAGCWAVSYSPSIQWSGPCAGGMVTRTGQQWGDMVRAMAPAYTASYRPRIQLWHGTSDTTINFNNQTEAIKEWTNVLGLSATPNTTTTVTLNAHTWMRQSWQDSCGITLLDAWAEQNGPHGTDANLNAMYVMPFLDLDKTGPDPQVACNDGGTSASSSSGSSGGRADAGAGADAGSSSGSGGGGSSSGGSGGGKGAGSSSSSGSGGGSNGPAGGSSSGGAGASSGGGVIGSSGGASGVGGTGSGNRDGGASEGGTPPSGASAGCTCDLATSRSGVGGTLAWGSVAAIGLAWGRRRRSKRSATRRTDAR